MISIAMASYNGAKYIGEQIDSILSQTIQDFEIVICDDCSTDNTFSILKQYEKLDSRIRVNRNIRNLGFKKNFEKVIGMCSGEYIALSDQDDIWMPNHLELLLGEVDSNMMIVCGRPVFVDENNIELPEKYDYFKMDYIPTTNKDLARHILLGPSTFQGASMLIKKDFFYLALPIPDNVNYHDSWFSALACFCGGLHYVDKPVMRYRRLESSVTYKTKHKSVFRTFLGSVLVNHSQLDRLAFIDNIRDRVKALDGEQCQFLDQMEQILKKRSSFVGRISNIPYYLKHFKAIYTFDGKHLFN